MSMFYDLLMAQSKKKKEPIWCEYLESDGGQWIETNIKANNQTTATLTASFPNNIETTFGIFGARTSASINNFSIGYASDSGLIIDFNDSDFLPFRTTLDETILDTNKYSFLISYNKRIIKNLTTGVESIGSRDCPDLFTTAYTLNIFRVAGNYFSQNNSVGKIYSVQLYDNNVLVRNFRPCLHPETLRPAMYDTVEKKYYYNEGTGEFSYKLGFTKLDYVESDDKTFLNTHYMPNLQRTTFELETNVLKLGGVAGFFGCRSNAGAFVYNIFTMPKQSVFSLRLDLLGEQLHTYTIPTNKFIVVKGGTREMSVGNVTYGGVGGADITSSEAICLFNMMDGQSGPRQVGTAQQLKYCKIYTDNILVRDYIPVRRNDGRNCLYDFVSGEYHEAQSTVSGNPFINLKGYLNGYQVGESLQVIDDGAYINTNVVPNSLTTQGAIFKSKLAEQQKLAVRGIFGCFYPQSNQRFQVVIVPKDMTYNVGYGDSGFPINKPADENKNSICVVDGYNKKIIFNQQTIDITGKEGDLDINTQESYLFATNQGAAYTSKMILYYSWALQNNKLIRSFIPARKGGFVGMVDVLTMKEYPNLGKNSFIFNE